MTVRSFCVLSERRTGDLLDVDVAVTCSSGTYIRALARDLGEALGVGGHVTALRRTRAGAYDLSMARTLDQLEAELSLIPLARAAADAFPSRQLTGDEARRLAARRAAARRRGARPGPGSGVRPGRHADRPGRGAGRPDPARGGVRRHVRHCRARPGVAGRPDVAGFDQGGDERPNR